MIALTLKRMKLGWSKARLGREAGLNSSTISLVEAGRFKPYPRQIAKLAAALGVAENDAAALLEPVPDEDSSTGAES